MKPREDERMTVCDCCGQLDDNAEEIAGIGTFCSWCVKPIQRALDEARGMSGHVDHSDQPLTIMDVLNGRPNETVHYTITTSDLDASSFKALHGELSENSMIMVASDVDGTPHYFAVRFVEMGAHCRWSAEEVYPTLEPDGGKKKRVHMDTHYEFALIAEGDDQWAIPRLQAKVETGIRNQTLERRACEGSIPDNVILRNGQMHSLKGTGTMRIGCSEHSSSMASFIIDGQQFTPAEVATMLSCYEGFELQYQITDGASPAIEEVMMLLPVKVDARDLLAELDEAIFQATDKRNFMAEDRIHLFDLVFYRILDKLALLYNNSPRGKVKLLGMEMIKRLEAIYTQDDMFPQFQVAAIREIMGGL